MNTIIINAEEWAAMSRKIDLIAKLVEQLAGHLPVDDNAWLSESEVCDRLKISPRTLQRLRKSGDIKFSRICRKYHYKASEVKLLIEKKTVKNNRERLEELKASHTKRFRE
jgi:excisionase family DNA binding protein